MKKFLKFSVLFLPLLTLGVYCDESLDTGGHMIKWFGGSDYENTPVTKLNTNTDVLPANSILEDLDPLTARDYTSLWVAQTDLDYTSSGTEAYWQVLLVNGNDTQSFDIPAISIEITAEFRGSNIETVTATTNANGWATWTRPKGQGAEQMYLMEITGELPWNSLDMDFWQTTPALSITAEEAQ